MPTYKVTVETRGREIYLIDAADEGDARKRWADDGFMASAEVYDAEVLSAVEEKD